MGRWRPGWILALPLTSALRGCLLRLTSCRIVGATGPHRKEDWEGAARPGGFIHWQCFCNTAATIPFVCNIARIPESLGVLGSPSSTENGLTFLTVAFRAELLTAQALRGQESGSDDVYLWPAPACLPCSSTDPPPPTGPTTWDGTATWDLPHFAAFVLDIREGKSLQRSGEYP